MLHNLAPQPDPARALANYRVLAAGYDSTCRYIAPLRQRAIDALQLRPGETVLDIACERSGPADARAGAGDDGALAGKTSHGNSSS